jgi:hypothetical protein
MISLLIWTLRILILVLLALPVIQPTVNTHYKSIIKESVTLFLPLEKAKFPNQTLELKKQLELSPLVVGRDLQIKSYGINENEQPALRYEDLLQQIEFIKGIVIVVPDRQIWDTSMQQIHLALQNSLVFKEKRLFQWLDREVESSVLGIVDVFLPKVAFLGEEIFVTMEVHGSIDAPSHSAEVVVHLGDSVLTSQRVTITSNSPEKNGWRVVKQMINIPVRFSRAGTQTVRVTLNSSMSPSPINQATTLTHIQHQKTTMLHVAVGPDWSLRTLRQKLKFWPNLDLLSYYILREATDDPRIPASELSLIEFPAEKLFGEQLPSFHGVIAQNFDFDQYLNPTDAENLLKYVQNGGRMVLQGGPLSFPEENSKLSALSPCSNRPTIDAEQIYHWEHSQTPFSASFESFSPVFSSLYSKQTAIGCIPKSDALVYAQTKEGAHPMVLAYTVGKGLVVTFMSNDWHLGAWNRNPGPEGDRELSSVSSVKRAQDIDSLFTWMMEFLQRRLDGGLRPPEILGPRLYSGDPFLLLRQQGPIILGESLDWYKDSFGTASGRTIHLTHLGLDGFQVSPSEDRTPPELSTKWGGAPQAKTVLSYLQFSDAKKEKSVPRSPWHIWPIFEGSSRSLERWSNPNVFAEVPSAHPESGHSLRETAELGTAQDFFRTQNTRKRPLLEAYPFLLAFALALFALEQFLTHFLVKPSPTNRRFS